MTFRVVASRTWQGRCPCRTCTGICEQIETLLAERRLVVSWEHDVFDVALTIHEIREYAWTDLTCWSQR